MCPARSTARETGASFSRRAVSNADRANPAEKNLAISSITIPNEVTRDLLPATGLSELIGDPFGGRMRSGPKPQDLPPAVAHDQQSIEQPERDCRHDEEVHCGNAISMVAKERLPSLRGRAVNTENLIRVDDVMESPKLTE
jgi:hypothetical protein